MGSWGRLVAGVLLAGASVCAAGCFGSGGPTIKPEGTPYRGPAVSLIEAGGQHQVVVSAPSAGWTVTMDRRAQTRDATRVFVTIRRPDPAMLYAQQMVEQRLATGVASDEPIELLVRVVDFDADSGAYVILRRAGGDLDG